MRMCGISAGVREEIRRRRRRELRAETYQLSPTRRGWLDGRGADRALFGSGCT